MKISDIMTQRSQKIIDEKKAALAKGDAGLAHEIGEGKDIMSICRASFLAIYVVLPDMGYTVRANMAAADNEKMTDEEILAQMSYVSLLHRT